jgi:hypothetical protein
MIPLIVDRLPMIDSVIHGESSYRYTTRRSHVLEITPYRTMKTFRLAVRHRRIGDLLRLHCIIVIGFTDRE